MKQPDSVKDISKHPGQPLAHVEPMELVPLPPPFDKLDEEPEFAKLSEQAREQYVVLDDTIAVNIKNPESKEEEDRLVAELPLRAEEAVSPKKTTGPSSSRSRCPWNIAPSA